MDREARLLERIGRGDREALASLHRANWKVVYSYVLRNNGNADDADDLLQEALIVLWERVRGGRFEQRARIGTFLFATVRNLWLRRLARSRRESATPDPPEPPAPADETPLELLIHGEETRAVAGALERLGEPCRTLLLLFYWEERSMEQIAVELGYANAATAKAKKYQCKKALERALAELIG